MRMALKYVVYLMQDEALMGHAPTTSSLMKRVSAQKNVHRHIICEVHVCSSCMQCRAAKCEYPRTPPRSKTNASKNEGWSAGMERRIAGIHSSAGLPVCTRVTQDDGTIDRSPSILRFV
jgi:hypothetical protein